MADIIRELEKEQLRTDLPKLEVGDTVRVFVKVIEGSRERLQNFEGVVIKIQGGGIRKSFTVRRISYGIGVERTFPYNSPRIGRIEVLRHGRRAYRREISLPKRSNQAPKALCHWGLNYSRRYFYADTMVPRAYGQGAAYAGRKPEADRRCCGTG